MLFKLVGASLALAASAVVLALIPGALSAQGPGGADALSAAREHVERNAAKLGVARTDVSDLVVTSRYRSDHSGIAHVNLNQRFQGREVFGGHITVNVADDGRVVFASGSLVEGLDESPSGTDDLSATEAVKAAA